MFLPEDNEARGYPKIQEADICGETKKEAQGPGA